MKTLYLKESLALLFACFALVGCGSMVTAKPAAERAIVDFHKLFNEQKFVDIYSAADSALKKAASEKQLTDLLSAVHRKLGTVTGSNNQTWNVSKFNFTTRIVMIQNTQFESGKGVETFTFQISGGKAILVGYNINSNDLITK